MLRYIYTSVLLCLLIIFSIQGSVFAQQEKIIFEHYSIAQGMYETNISSLIQDDTGFLWFGTHSGLEKFDGHNFTNYKNDPDDTNSIDNAIVNTLYEDSEGYIWLGTRNGLDKFNYKTGNFAHYQPTPDEPKSKLTNNVVSIYEDDDNNILWIGALDGLHKFNKLSGRFIKVPLDENNSNYTNNPFINVILKDISGYFWFGTSNGLYRLNKTSEKFEHFWFNSMDSSFSSDYHVNTVFEDKAGFFWLGTQNGLVKFDPKTFSSIRYLNGESNSITSICEDEYGTLWIGTSKNGLYTIDKVKLIISRYAHNAEERSSISSNYISSVYRERSGTIWVTTSIGGVNKINRVKMPFKKYPVEGVTQIIKGSNDKIWISTTEGWKIFYPEDEKIVSYSFGSDYLVEEEKSGDLWIGKSSGGIYKRNANGSITNFYSSSPKEFTKPISCFLKDSEGRIWLGTKKGEGGIYKIEPNQNRVVKVLQLNGNIKDFYMDDLGVLWIATFERGLFCFDPAKNIIIKNYSSQSQYPYRTKGRTYFEIVPDKRDLLWIATEKGLCKYDRLKDSLIYYTEKDGLPHELIFSMLIDSNGDLWLITMKTISKFDTKTNKFQNYDVSYGVPENGLSYIYGCKTENGEMYFGYPGGIIRFHPDSIRINSFIPPVVITAVKKLDTTLPIAKEINFSYDENFLSFEFVALSYLSQERNQYAYMMEGIDTGWVYSGKRRFATYPNLEPGSYVFKVKGSNNDGVWNEAGTSIAIFISPPWWKTWWAYSFYASCFIFALYTLRRYEMNRISYKNQLKVNQAVLQEKEETEKIKSRFFANISHEFRTPLTLILGPVEKILSNNSKDIVKDVGTIKRNAQRLLQLVNQLLDLSRLEAGKLKLEASKGNIVSFVKGIALSFESLSESKDITLKLQSDKDHIELYFDKEKMIKILSNILSNAFKFTPEEGKITVSVRKCHGEFISASSFGQEIPKRVRDDKMKEYIEIKIKDTGIGIPQEDIPKLFDRFYQVDSSLTKEYEGTGIGLALTKELVELHHGSISVESKIGEWTEFTINFPAGRDHLKDEEIIEEIEIKTDVILNPDVIGMKNLTLQNPTVTNKKEDSLRVTQNDGEDKTIILIVEDNYDMREYIKDSLDPGYQIEEAINGEQGVSKAEKIIPDLIISDMMMPKMDGHELTRILKNNEKTSHIPIILLTAKSEQSDKIEGLKQGADDYLTKPYDAKELQVRIDNLISIRKRLQEKYGSVHNAVKQVEKKLNNLDEEFMRRVIAVIEKKLSDENFSIEEFSNELNMSRIQLHRKLKAITGKSASHFLRSVRLEKAKQFIEEQKGNISEIAYSVGFSSPAYFTKCFKDEFGYLPSNLQNKL
ncbi:MAG: response regulator [Ignavibacteriales bacterium]|nr:MAG: response regulator [Ignavibacteriales bacterium]